MGKIDILYKCENMLSLVFCLATYYEFGNRTAIFAFIKKDNRAACASIEMKRGDT